jgi:NADH-quinone oxidoreductase subunit A
MFELSWPIFLAILASTAIPLGLLLAGIAFGPARAGAVKEMPYESGMDPIHDTRRRFDVRFHLVAIAFLVFDVELLFLYPWAASSRPFVNASPKAGADVVAADVAAPVELLGIDAAVADGLVESRGLVFGEAMVFIALLAAGYVYAWRKGVFQWR